MHCMTIYVTTRRCYPCNALNVLSWNAWSFITWLIIICDTYRSWSSHLRFMVSHCTVISFRTVCAMGATTWAWAFPVAYSRNDACALCNGNILYGWNWAFSSGVFSTVMLSSSGAANASTWRWMATSAGCSCVVWTCNVFYGVTPVKRSVDGPYPCEQSTHGCTSKCKSYFYVWFAFPSYSKIDDAVAAVVPADYTDYVPCLRACADKDVVCKCLQIDTTRGAGKRRIIAFFCDNYNYYCYNL